MVKAKKVIENFLFFFLFVMLSISSFFTVFLGYGIVKEKELTEGLRISFISDIIVNREYDVYISPQNIALLCEFDVNIEDIPNFDKYKPLFCAKVSNGEMKDGKEVKEFFADVYFKEAIRPALKEVYFKPANELLLISSAITAIFFILVAILSHNEGKKALVSSLIINTAYLVILIIMVKGLIDDSVNANIPEDYLKSFPATIKYLKNVIQEAVIYSAIISFLISESAAFLGKGIEVLNRKLRE